MAVSVGNQVILVVERMGLAWKRHEPLTELVQPRVHRLVDATQPQRLVLQGVVIVEGVNHLSDLVEAIHKKERRFLACVADQFHDLAEGHFHHVFVETKRGHHQTC